MVENEGIQGKALKGFERLRERLAETSFKTWIEPMSDIKITENVFYAKVKDDFHKGILEAKYAKEIKMVFGVKEVILTI